MTLEQWPQRQIACSIDVVPEQAAPSPDQLMFNCPVSDSPSYSALMVTEIVAR